MNCHEHPSGYVCCHILGFPFSGRECIITRFGYNEDTLRFGQATFRGVGPDMRYRPLLLTSKCCETLTLFRACRWIYDLVEHLVRERPQDINAIGGSHDYSLVAALHGGYMRVVELLFQRGADFSIQGTSKQVSLHKVARWRDNLSDGALPLLLKHLADVNARDAHNTTPLHSASYYLRLKTVRMFFDLGANVNAEDDWGRTPFQGASADKDDDGEVLFDVAKLLMERGANVNASSINRKPPYTLHRALCRSKWLGVFSNTVQI